MEPIFFIVSPLLIEVFAIYFAVRSFTKYRLITMTRTNRICNIDKGTVELKGELVSLDEPLKSPLRSKTCLYYKLEIQKESHYLRYAGWETIVEDTKATRVGLKDGTGTVEIDILQAQSDFMVDKINDEGIIGEPTQGVINALKNAGKYDEKIFLKGSTRFIEALYLEGEEVFVFGNAIKNEKGKVIVTKGSKQFFITRATEEELTKTHLLVFSYCIGISIALPMFLFWAWKYFN